MYVCMYAVAVAVAAAAAVTIVIMLLLGGSCVSVWRCGVRGYDAFGVAVVAL